MSIMDREIQGYGDVFERNRQSVRESFPQMFAPLELVVNKKKPDTKKLLRQEQKRTLKNWRKSSE